MMYLSEKSIPNFEEYRRLFVPFFDRGLPSQYEDMEEFAAVLEGLHPEIESELKDLEDELSNVDSRMETVRSQTDLELRDGILPTEEYIRLLKKNLGSAQSRFVRSMYRIRIVRSFVDEDYDTAYSILQDYNSLIRHPIL